MQEEYFKELLQEYETSSDTLEEYIKRKELPLSEAQFYYWKRKYKGRNLKKQESFIQIENGFNQGGIEVHYPNGIKIVFHVPPTSKQLLEIITR